MTIIVHGTWLFRMFLYLAMPYDEYPLVGLPRGIASTGIVSIDVDGYNNAPLCCWRFLAPIMNGNANLHEQFARELFIERRKLLVIYRVNANISYNYGSGCLILAAMVNTVCLAR